MLEPETCPTCGGAVRICGGKKGVDTVWYEPVRLSEDPEAVERARRAVEDREGRFAAEGAARRLFERFRSEYEADPFGNPDMGVLTGLVREHGDYGEGYLWGLVESYLERAPEPRWSPEQRAALRRRAEAVMRRMNAQPPEGE
jgi:hypothetical protein